MKKLLFLFVTLLLTFGCTNPFDDTEINNRLDDLENRVSKLEELCKQMNTNISSLQTIVAALQNNDYITSVTPITENGEEIGYTITFAKSNPITIYHGQDGKDGYTPVIGVRQDTDGIYYWTLDGEWLLDDDENKIKAVGTDGITPYLKIEDGYWYISYDNGATWTMLGKATGEDGKDGSDGDSMFKEIKEDDSFVYFILVDGAEIKVPKAAPLSINFDTEDLVVMMPNSERDIRYTIESKSKELVIEVLSSSDINAKVISETDTTGKIHVETSDVIDEYSKVVVFVSDDVRVIMRTILFEEEGLEIKESNEIEVSDEGGNISLYYLANTECDVIIPEEATWLHLVETKALLEHQIILSLDSNHGYARSANVVLRSESGMSITYTIEQKGELEPIDPTTVPDNEIWYISSAAEPYEFNDNYSSPFDANIISHYKKNGKFIIEFDSPIHRVDWYDYNVSNASGIITEVYLPDCVENIGGFPSFAKLNKLYIPKNLKTIYTTEGGLEWDDNISRFYGNNISEDEKSIVIDGQLCAIAPYGLEEYELPNNIETVGRCAFSGAADLKKVVLPEGVRNIEYGSFWLCEKLEEVYLPNSIEYIGSYAFNECSKIKRFYGPSNFVSNDGLCLYSDNYDGNYRYLLKFANGAGVTEYSLPEGIEVIDAYSFTPNQSLQKLVIPTTLQGIKSGVCFERCDKLSELYGANTSEDHHCLIIDNTLCYFAGKGVKEYTIPDNVLNLGYQAFYEATDLEILKMSDNVKSVDNYGYLFWGCSNLREVTISANMENLAWDPFGHNELCSKLEKVYCRAIIPPTIKFNNSSIKFDNLKIYVPEESLNAYKSLRSWEPYREYLVGCEYTDLPELDIDYYYSTNYSNDGNVTTVQTATVGNGIDLVFMGDAFSDREIADGTYRAAMEHGINALFSKEPYKSYKDMFNIYIVDVVSLTEGYEHIGQALSTFFGSGTYVGGNDVLCMEYAQKAITEDCMDEVSIVVMMNENAYAGTCFMYEPDANAGDYGCGLSVAYFPVNSNTATLSGFMLHETGGHGFAKLDDEYAYEDYGQVPAEYIYRRQQQERYGWWNNTDDTNDPASVKWAHFLADNRYQYDGLGVFEGASTYWTGMWRPTYNSIMNNNTGDFNAPSREAIYYRIHKLAYGESWEYDYEDFVAYDKINRKTAEEAADAAARPQNIAPWRPTTPPVVVGKTWREAMEEVR